MVLLFHGEAGGWDELIIALVAFAVLWLAVKLAGRKPVEDEDVEPVEHLPRDEEAADVAARPPAAPRG